jgi:hypothetical protein
MTIRVNIQSDPHGGRHQIQITDGVTLIVIDSAEIDPNQDRNALDFTAPGQLDIKPFLPAGLTD